MITPHHTLNQCKLNLTSLSSLIDHCLSLNSLPSSESLHAQFLKLGFHGHTFLANRFLNLYSHVNSLTPTLQFFREIPTKNTFTWNILLSTFLKTGRMEDAHHLFLEMPERDTVSWNSMISGYASISLINKAFETLYRMQELGFRPTKFTFSITASYVPSAQQAKQVHGSAIRHGFDPSNIVLGNSVIKMYGRVGLVGYACNVFRFMENPDIVSWNTMISVFGNSGQGDRALDCLKEMRDNGFLLDEFTISTAISVCTGLEDLAKDWTILFGSFKKW